MTGLIPPGTFPDINPSRVRNRREVNQALLNEAVGEQSHVFIKSALNYYSECEVYKVDDDLGCGFGIVHTVLTGEGRKRVRTYLTIEDLETATISVECDCDCADNGES